MSPLRTQHLSPSSPFFFFFAPSHHEALPPRISHLSPLYVLNARLPVKCTVVTCIPKFDPSGPSDAHSGISCLKAVFKGALMQAHRRIGNAKSSRAREF